MAVGLAAARGTIGRKQSVVPVVCYGSGRKQHDSQDNYVAPNRDRASSSAQKPFRALPRVQRRVSRSRKTDEGAGLCDNPLRVLRKAPLRRLFDVGQIGFGGKPVDCREMAAANLLRDRAI
jgi:hypothetical protein